MSSLNRKVKPSSPDVPGVSAPQKKDPHSSGAGPRDRTLPATAAPVGAWTPASQAMLSRILEIAE